jgi:hypothetical protein
VTLLLALVTAALAFLALASRKAKNRDTACRVAPIADPRIPGSGPKPPRRAWVTKVAGGHHRNRVLRHLIEPIQMGQFARLRNEFLQQITVEISCCDKDVAALPPTFLGFEPIVADMPYSTREHLNDLNSPPDLHSWHSCGASCGMNSVNRLNKPNPALPPSP